jgi:hypothetical protein
VIQLAGALVDQLLDHAALLIETHLRHGGRFEGIENAKQVLALPKDNLRRPRSRALGLRLHKIRASHRYLAQ